MPMRGMEVEPVPQADQIPTHMIALVHGHHRHVAVQIAINGETNIRGDETASNDGEIAICIAGVAIEFVHGLRLGGVGLNVVVEIPTVVFVDDEIGRHKFAVNILRSTIGTSHALLGDDDGSNESGVSIMTLEIMRVIKPNNRAG